MPSSSWLTRGSILLVFAACGLSLTQADARPKRHAMREPSVPACAHGSVLDGHSGRARCMSAEESMPPEPNDSPTAPGAPSATDGGPSTLRPDPRDGGVPPSDAGMRKRSADCGGLDAPDDFAAPLRGVVGKLEELVFDNGDVPKAQAVLEKAASRELARCVSEAGGPRGAREGKLRVRFLVRAPGRAEGIDVAEARNLSSQASRCLTTALAHRYVGPPSEEPVAVTATLVFTSDPP